MSQVFNPAEYGLSKRYCKRSHGGSGRSENNEVFMYAGKHSLQLKMPPSVGKAIVEKFGERIDFDFKPDGQVFIWSGDARKVSINKRFNTGKWSISMDMAFDDYTDAMGSFKRLYMDVDFHDTHVVFSPNGKRKPPKRADA